MTVQPKLRFKGFTDAWEKRKMSEMFKITRGKVLSVDKVSPFSNSEYRYPVYSSQTKNNGLVGFYNSFLFENAITWTTDGANAGTVNYRPEKFFSTNVNGVLLEKQQRPNQIIAEALNKVAYRFVSKVGNPKLMNNVMADIVISVPIDMKEQQQMSDLFSKLDNLVVVNQSKVDLLKELKKGFLQKMFPKNGEDKPEIRFAGYTDAWEKRKLGDIMDVTSVKRIHQSDWKTTGVPFYRARDLVSLAKNFPIAEPIFIDKDTYENYSKKSGKVKRNELLVTGVGTLGIAYLVPNDEPLYFKDGNVIWFRNNTLNGNFLYYSFMTTQVQKFIKLSAGTGTVGTYTIESGKKTIISVPIKNEQQKIGDLFQKLDQLITVNQRRVDLLKQEKKALLQKMFV